MKIVVLDRASMGFDTDFSVLEKYGSTLIYDHSSPEESILRAKEAEVLIINKVKITRDLISNAEKLKLVCVFATGFDNIDLSAARDYGIAVCNVPGYSTESVTLYTIATVLSLCARLRQYNDYVRSGEYSVSGAPNRLEPVFHDLSRKKWGIIGYGNIGKSVAKVAKALGAEVIVNKRSPEPGVEVVDLDSLCRESDIITIHCPLNDDSRGIINEERINLMKKNVIIVNEARGAVVDEAAVANAVLNGKISAFGCDVYSVEPFTNDHPYYAIKDMDNVLLTPHSAWGSYEARAKCVSIIAENIDSFINGKMKNRVDK